MTSISLPEHVQGDTFSYEFNFINETTQLIPDLSIYDWYLTIKINPALSDDDPLSAQSHIAAGSQVEASNGRLKFSIPASVMQRLTPANYFFDLQRVERPEDSEPIVHTYISGRIRIVKQVTHAS